MVTALAVTFVLNTKRFGGALECAFGDALIAGQLDDLVFRDGSPAQPFAKTACGHVAVARGVGLTGSVGSGGGYLVGGDRRDAVPLDDRLAIGSGRGWCR